LLIGILLVSGCMGFRTNDVKTKQYFDKKGVPVKIHHEVINGKKVRYIETLQIEGDTLPIVFFVHGSPGSSDNFFEFMSDSFLLERSRMISVDRLGYGYSEYGHPETSIPVQVAVIRSILDKYTSRQVILVGHSYGGPIIARFAMDHPGMVNGILLLAPAIDPDGEKIFWFSYFAKWKITRWMLSGSLKVAGDEKFSHEEELRKMESGWSKIDIPVVHLHGEKDNLVPYRNVEFSRKVIADSYLKVVSIPKANHFFLWSQPTLVVNEIRELLK